MRKLVKKLIKSKYGWILPLFEVIAMISGIFWIGYCIDGHRWTMLVGIIILFITKCYFITSVISDNYNENWIKAMNHNSLSCPKCHNKTLEFHDDHYYGSKIRCTTCGYSKESE